jgi:hypothetical protein
MRKNIGMNTHNSHVTRFSDSSRFDEICVNCGLTDNAGLLRASDLTEPCTKPVGSGGKTIEQWQEEDKQRVAKLTMTA